MLAEHPVQMITCYRTRPLAQRSHPHTSRLEDGEPTCPIVARRYEIGQPLSGRSGFGIGMRNNMTPHECGKAIVFANSPKSLSK